MPLHEANVARAIIGRHVNALSEDYDDAIQAINNLEGQLIQMHQELTAKPMPAHKNGRAVIALTYMVNNLFDILGYPADLRAMIERRMSTDVENPTQVLDEIMQHYVQDAVEREL